MPEEHGCALNVLGGGLQGKGKGRRGWLVLQGHFVDGRGGFARHGLTLAPIPLVVSPTAKKSLQGQDE